MVSISSTWNSCLQLPCSEIQENALCISYPSSKTWDPVNLYTKKRNRIKKMQFIIVDYSFSWYNQNWKWKKHVERHARLVSNSSYKTILHSKICKRKVTDKIFYIYCGKIYFSFFPFFSLFFFLRQDVSPWKTFYWLLPLKLWIFFFFKLQKIQFCTTT